MRNERTLHIGIAPREFVKRITLEIARGKKIAPNMPKLWVSSLQSLAKILSDENMLLLEIIRNSKPESVTELAELSGRAKSNLSRTLRTMVGLGLIELREINKKKAPFVAFDKLEFEFDLQRPRAA